MNAVVFDMDGVLFDTERLAIKCWDWVGEQVGLGKVGYMVHKTMGRTTSESVKIFEKEFGSKFNNDNFQKHIKIFNENYFNEHGVPKKEGLISILKYLKENGYKTAVASSSSRKSVMHHLNDANITSYFDTIICGDMVTKSKPEPDIYITACNALGEKSENCYAVEDSRAGIWSAYNAGCKTIMIPDLYIADDETNNVIFKKFENLTKFQEYLKAASE
jgi:HAD superfamily hydrolase (TIGR01509 family)